MSNSNYVIGEQIKEGQGYKLLQAKHKISNEVIILKSCDPTYKGGIDNKLIHAQQLKNLSSKHLVRIYDMLEEEGNLNIYLEYADQGSLFDALEQAAPSGGFPEKQAVHFLKQVLALFSNHALVHQHSDRASSPHATAAGPLPPTTLHAFQRSGMQHVLRGECRQMQLCGHVGEFEGPPACAQQRLLPKRNSSSYHNFQNNQPKRSCSATKSS